MTLGVVTRRKLPILAATSVLIVASALFGATKKAVDKQGPCADITPAAQGQSKKASVTVHATGNSVGKSNQPRAAAKVAHLQSSPNAEGAPASLHKTSSQPVKKAHMVRDRDFAALEASAPQKGAVVRRGAQGGAQ